MNESIHELATAIGELEPVAKGVTVPAKELLRLFKEATPAMAQVGAARVDAEKAEARIRELCSR